MDKRLYHLYASLINVEQLYANQDMLMLRTNSGINFERTEVEKDFIGQVSVLMDTFDELLEEMNSE